MIPELSDGMTGAVQYGTARRLRTNFSEEEILGKTGTCSKDGTRFGWFTSYANTQYGHIVTVIFLRVDAQPTAPRRRKLPASSIATSMTITSLPSRLRRSRPMDCRKP